MRLPGAGRIRRSTLLAMLAGVVLVAVAAGVLTASASPRGGPLKPARPFSLTRLGAPGQQVALTQDARRPVVVNFFASWCTPCQKETPLLARFYRAHHGRVLVIGVDSNDQSAAALKFLRTHGVAYPVGYDPSASVAVSYGVLALPQTFFLNARHQIVRHVIGAVTQRELTAWADSLPHSDRAS